MLTYGKIERKGFWKDEQFVSVSETVEEFLERATREIDAKKSTIINHLVSVQFVEPNFVYYWYWV